MSLLIYGAAGYTGSMIARHARASGLDIVLGGRDAAKLAPLAAELGVPYRVFQADTDAAVQALNGAHVLLNCAGPFAQTAEPLMRACIAAGVHYLDITAEIGVYRLAERLGAEAEKARAMLLPGVGWDVVPTDCLAVQLAARVARPTALRIALQVAGSMSRGSAVSAGEIMAAGLLARVAGELVPTPNAQPRAFDFGQGPVACAPLSFGDLVTAWRSTGIADIAMFVNVTGDAFPTGDLAALPAGPSAQERAAQPARAVVEVTGADGATLRAVIETVNGYSYTPLAAVEAARRVLDGSARPGFETPARVFGPGFAQAIPGTRVIELA
ncbi:saccharopine dehydrogenase NADP-binding domain-containing protein [Acidovorax sp. CCYZU-2555]|uniref:saccharopine dehydrogenase family protein n=1 Tax=Acidovorax sp. CCYZU-2555 TaxID=2835042 RepID=UPI001BCE7537|nr:saccharopine dehydrogenase NADP-binding domain-containing protein [Acidovorax sp. CCYZU-2555]MBS7779296.1 saccharopine dehydrogenase NADP-binding domain-containing protein [Acidovorax sp. CCYZU-2555]